MGVEVVHTVEVNLQCNKGGLVVLDDVLVYKSVKIVQFFEQLFIGIAVNLCAVVVGIEIIQVVHVDSKIR